VTGHARQFVFNGDNKQVQVNDTTASTTAGTYSYDGNGKRVKKVTNAETTVFVYDGLGKLVAEYSTATPPSNPTINYTATDQLGSPRLLTNSFGEGVSRRDFMPFGEEIYADGTNRTITRKYSTSSQDAVRQRFTGYQREPETGLDFAEARYYNNQHGRFTAVDPLLASGQSANPQTFNRYTYALNRALLLKDPSGLQAGTDEIVAHIQSLPAWFNDVLKSMQQRADYLLGASTGLSNLDRLNGQRAEGRINSFNDGSVPTDRLIGNRGPTTDSVVQAATDAVRNANTVNEIGLTINTLVLAVPVPGGSSTVATSVGTAVDSAEAGIGGFRSYGAFKRAFGGAGDDMNWHHIVEQRSANVEKFGAEAIHNPDNIVSIPKEMHDQVSAYYSSKRPFTGGQTVRQWLGTKGYREQYDFGISVLRNFGWTP
jgi:RHS repeat-associated protein